MANDWSKTHILIGLKEFVTRVQDAQLTSRARESSRILSSFEKLKILNAPIARHVSLVLANRHALLCSLLCTCMAKWNILDVGCR